MRMPYLHPKVNAAPVRSSPKHADSPRASGESAVDARSLAGNVRAWINRLFFRRHGAAARRRTTGSHFHYKHPSKPGTLSVPGGGKGGRDVAPGTLRSILKQAGLQ